MEKQPLRLLVEQLRTPTAWNTGATTATATGLTAGTYTVTATDANGCTATDTVQIDEPTVLVASISLDSNVSCNGGNDGSLTASGSGGTPVTHSFGTTALQLLLFWTYRRTLHRNRYRC